MKDIPVEGDALVGAQLPSEVFEDSGTTSTILWCKHGDVNIKQFLINGRWECPMCDYKTIERALHRPINALAPGTGANARQVGGAHYGLSNLQHWDLSAIFGWDYMQGQIIKYLMRWKSKNGLQDVEKSQHYLEKYIEQIKAGIYKPDA